MRWPETGPESKRTNFIVSFRNQGGFSTVMPDFPGSLQVKGVVEIQVK